MTEEATPVHDDQTPHSGDDNSNVADQSFREHAAKLREKRREKGVAERTASSFSSGESPGEGGNGNPLTPMRSGGPSGPGSRDEQERVKSDELVREVCQLRDELREQIRALNRIADALTDT